MNEETGSEGLSDLLRVTELKALSASRIDPMWIKIRVNLASIFQSAVYILLLGGKHHKGMVFAP